MTTVESESPLKELLARLESYSLSAIETAEKTPVYMVTCKSRKLLKISENVYFLLSRLKAGATFESISKQLSIQHGLEIAPSKIQHVCQDVIERLETMEQEPIRTQPLHFKLVIFPEHMVVKIARSLSLLFHPSVYI